MSGLAAVIFQGRVQVRVGTYKPGPWVALPEHGRLSAGRTPGYALHLPSSWIPQKLCRFLPYELGWVVQVGPSPRMNVRYSSMSQQLYPRRAAVALQRGTSVLTFPELDDFLSIAVVIGPDAAVGAEQRWDQVDESDLPRVGTRYAVVAAELTDKQRLVVETTYRHLVTREPTPANITAAAAQNLGTSEQSVKNQLNAVMKKINKERWGPALQTWEQLGSYLWMSHQLPGREVR
ncbi:hypothetical protein [Nocardioides sp. GY 10127]|uniref:hypothetical protein n=1 Tax=Nocardioides sp. GY 10127 TaxID=2569762 RepID=UPI0010A78BED|nr:hypothetical protein [Nocardioides sp. GY 10127]TIC84432.1 hypothetical protein E8D37_06620 [Nocardioides sp. GY 10127]